MEFTLYYSTRKRRSDGQGKKKSFEKGKEKMHLKCIVIERRNIKSFNTKERENGRFNRGQRKKTSIEGRERGNDDQGERKSFNIGERENAPPDVL